MIDLATIPQIDGDMTALAGHATAIAAAGVGFADVGERVHSGWQGLGAVYVAPEAAQLMAATGPVMTVTASVGEDLEAAAAALHTYAAEVTGIQQRCAALRAQATALNAAWMAVQDESTTVTLEDRESGLTAAVAAEVAAWEAAQITCANALRALSGSAPLLPVGPPGGPLEVVVAGTDQALTFDDPVANGMPPTSGYAADPVCTATGHFVEVEVDLDAPSAAALLTVTRVYGSRHARTGPFGRGWSSWASARLDREPAGVLLTGPDGRRARLTRTADGYGRVPGIAADLVDSADGGWRLSWFAGDEWRFDSTGRPIAVEDARGAGVTTFTWLDDRLVAVVAPNGRRLDVDWEGERIVTVRADDGRRVRYGYDDAGDLIAVCRPSGDRRYTTDDRGRIVSVTDADGVIELVNTYDDADRVVEQLSPHDRRDRRCGHARRPEAHVSHVAAGRPGGGGPGRRHAG